MGPLAGQRGRRLGHEARVRVVDAAGALVLVDVDSRARLRDQQDDERDQSQRGRAWSVGAGACRGRSPARGGSAQAASLRDGASVAVAAARWLRPARPRRYSAVPCVAGLRGACSATPRGRLAVRAISAGDAQREQPQAGDRQRRQRESGDEREHVVVAVQRPAPQQIVAEGEPGNEDQRPVGHATNPRDVRGRTAARVCKGASDKHPGWAAGAYDR